MTGNALRIMQLAERDILPCAALMAASEPWTRYGITAEVAAALWDRALREGARVCVARLEEQTVGFAWYIPQAGFGLSGYLKLLGVDAAIRGHGIGGALLRHIEQQTLADNQDDLFLLVSAFNEAAQRFYRRHGYQQVGRLADYVAPGITELIYRKHLSQGNTY